MINVSKRIIRCNAHKLFRYKERECLRFSALHPNPLPGYAVTLLHSDYKAIERIEQFCAVKRQEWNRFEAFIRADLLTENINVHITAHKNRLDCMNRLVRKRQFLGDDVLKQLLIVEKEFFEDHRLIEKFEWQVLRYVPDQQAGHFDMPSESDLFRE